MNDCSVILPIILKDFHTALENYHQSIADNKKCKKSYHYINNTEEIDICSDYYIKIRKTELQTQSELYNSVFKTCSLNK